MGITDVSLTNYRCHKHLVLEFRPRFNALVGVNGCGKTSILTAVSQALEVPLTGVIGNLNEDVVRLEVQRQNGKVYFAPHYPLEIRLAMNVAGNDHEFVRFRTDNVSSFGSKGRLPTPWWEAPGPRPLVSYYRASRHWETGPQTEMQAATDKPKRSDGYANWADASSGAMALKVWAVSKCLERFQVSSETGALFDEIVDDELALVNGALALAVAEVRGLRYDLKEKSLLVERIADMIPFDYLSDGQKSVIGLVADIARRMCLLNPMLGNRVLEDTEGVVLIDELDLHLHPGWQRSLTRGLKSAFPKIQFVVASHSPQVLAELEPDEILLLQPGKGTGEHPEVSYGLDASSVLEVIMGTTAHPPEIETALEHLFRDLETEEFVSVQRQIDNLREKSPGLTELVRAEALLKRKQVLGR